MTTEEAIQSALWKAQLSHYPKSEFLTPAQVIDWAYDSTLHCRSVLMTIQFKEGVFYRIPYSYVSRVHGGSVSSYYRGFRYGLDGPDYLSF